MISRGAFQRMKIIMQPMLRPAYSCVETKSQVPVGLCKTEAQDGLFSEG